MSSSIRLDITAEYSEAVDALDRLVTFARAIDALGLEVLISGELSTVVRAIEPDQPEPEPEPEP